MLILLGDVLVYVSRQAVKIAKGRHRTRRAVREKRRKLFLALQGRPLASKSLELPQVELTVSGKYRHQGAFLAAYHDNLCLVMTGNILSRRSHPGGESFGVRHDLIVDLIFRQKVEGVLKVCS